MTRSTRAGAALFLAWTLVGCQRQQVYMIGGAAEAEKPQDEPTVDLLSAHLPGLERDADGEALFLVFGEQLDPMTVGAGALMVVRADGSRILARRATLAPADERDEARSVTAWGDFVVDGRPPRQAVIVRPFYTASGRSLEAATAEIRPPEQPDEVVAIEALEPRVGRCEGAVAVVRSYWSDNLGQPSEDLLAKVEVGKRRVQPRGFDDHVERGPQDPRRRDDNVVDFCFDEPVEGEVRVGAGAFRDRHGNATAASVLEIKGA